jgi:hypothetical protein
MHDSDMALILYKSLVCRQGMGAGEKALIFIAEKITKNS